MKREAEENFGALTFSGSVPPVRAAVKLNDVALSLRAVGGLEQVRLCVFRTDALGRRWLICIIFDAKIVRAAETGLALFKTVVLRKLCKQRRAGWLLGKLGRGLGPARSIDGSSWPMFISRRSPTGDRQPSCSLKMRRDVSRSTWQNA